MTPTPIVTLPEDGRMPCEALEEMTSDQCDATVKAMRDANWKFWISAEVWLSPTRSDTVARML